MKYAVFTVVTTVCFCSIYLRANSGDPNSACKTSSECIVATNDCGETIALSKTEAKKIRKSQEVKKSEHGSAKCFRIYIQPQGMLRNPIAKCIEKQCTVEVYERSEAEISSVFENFISFNAKSQNLKVDDSRTGVIIGEFRSATNDMLKHLKLSKCQRCILGYLKSFALLNGQPDEGLKYQLQRLLEEYSNQVNSACKKLSSPEKKDLATKIASLSLSPGESQTLNEKFRISAKNCISAPQEM